MNVAKKQKSKSKRRALPKKPKTVSVQLAGERVGKRLKVTALHDGQTIHFDTIDFDIAAQRERFIKGVCKRLPGANAAMIEADLLKLPGRTLAVSPVELDVSRIIRPEQFFTADVAGMAVPVFVDLAGKPAARWMLFLRWADGRREVREFANTIDLSSGPRIWIHPTLAEPSINTIAGWSGESRRAWLGGAVPPDPAELFRRICERIAEFIDLPADVAAGTAATLALWSILSYIYQAWDAVPYLYLAGPLGSGKTRVFEILARLTFRALLSSNLTAPALFRTLHDRGGVVLYDEAERLRQSTPEAGEVLSMLLAGYKRGGQATRLEPVGDSFKTVAFDVFGPKALACIAGLPPALTSRCIRVTMFRAGPDSPKPKRRIDADPDEWQQLRDDLYTLLLEHGTTWRELSERSEVCPSGISGRDYELWQPLLSLAWWVESHGAVGLLDLMQRHALDTIGAETDDQIPEADEMLLELLTEAVRAGERPRPKDILDKAQERDPNTFNPKFWHPSSVSRRLKSYGIPIPRKTNGERRYREVSLAMLRRIQRHYRIDLGIEEADTPPGLTLTDPVNYPVPREQGR